MKKLTLVLALALALPFCTYAQDETASEAAGEAVNAFGASMMGGLGITTIDGKLYYRVQLVPELSVGKFGLGIDGDLLFNQDGIRKEDWTPRSRWVRVIRYVRWGRKRDQVYARVGALDAATLGNGFLMNRYSNRVDDVERKTGMELDVDFGQFGLESVLSNFGRAEVYGGRAYARPLRSTEIPVIRNFEVGLSGVTDADPDRSAGTDDAVTAFGFDLGQPLVNTSLLFTGLYFDFGKIVHFGSGAAVGVKADLHLPGGMVDLGAKLEQRFLGKRFLPQYFDRFYELERFNDLSGMPVRKTYLLGLVDQGRNGTYGELSATVAGKLNIVGSYQYTYQVPKSGILHFETDLTKVIPKIELRAAYDHKGIGDFKDVGKKDENVLVTVEGGYEVYSHVMLYLTYLRTYERRTQDQDGSGGLLPPYYKAVEKFSPRLAVKFGF